MNFDIDPSEVQPVPPGLQDDSEWGQYPQSLFSNWTCDQVNRSQMLTKCSNRELSTVYKIGVFDDGNFDKKVEARTVRKDDIVDLRGYWNYLRIPVSSMVVEHLEAEAAVIATLEYPSTSTFCRGNDAACPPNARNKVFNRLHCAVRPQSHSSQIQYRTFLLRIIRKLDPV
jgi:hypothetical protein